MLHDTAWFSRSSDIKIYRDTVGKCVFDVVFRILYFSIVRTVPFNPLSSFVDFFVFSSLCERYQRCDIVALSQFISAAAPWQGIELCLWYHFWVPNTMLMKGCIGDCSVNEGEISQLKICNFDVCHTADRNGRCETDGGFVCAHLITNLLVVVVLRECDV